MTIQDFLNQLYGGSPPSPPSSPTYQPDYTQVSGVDAIKQAVREKASFGILQAGARSTASYDLSQAWTGYQPQPQQPTPPPPAPQQPALPAVKSALPVHPKDREFKVGQTIGREFAFFSNAIYKNLPEDQQVGYLGWNPEIKIGDRLYFNPEANEITSDKNFIPVYLDNNRSWTVEETEVTKRNPAYLTEEKTKEFYNQYYYSAANLPLQDRIRMDDAIEIIKQNPITPARVEQQQKSWDFVKDETYWFENMEGNPTPITFSKRLNIEPLQRMDEYVKKVIQEGQQPYYGQLTRGLSGGLATGKRILGDAVRGMLTHTMYVNPELLKPILQSEQDFNSMTDPSKFRYLANKYGWSMDRLTSIVSFCAGKTFEQAKEEFDLLEAVWEQKGGEEVADAVSVENIKTLLSQWWELSSAPRQDLDDVLPAELKGGEEDWRNVKIKDLQAWAQQEASNYYNQSNKLFYEDRNLDEAVKVRKQAYAIEGKFSLNDSNFAYSFFGDEESYDRFLTARAVIELQRPEAGVLSQMEIRQLQARFTDPTIELMGEMFIGDASDLFTAYPIGETLTQFTPNAAKSLSRFVGADIADMKPIGLMFHSLKGTGSWIADTIKLSRSPLVQGALDMLSKTKGLFKLSARTVARDMAMDADMVLRSFVKGGDTVDIQELTTAWNKLGVDVASIKQELLFKGEFPNVENVSRALEAQGVYAAHLITPEKVNALIRLTDEINPLDMSLKETTWQSVLDDSIANSKKLLEEGYLKDLKKGILDAAKREGLGLDEIDVLQQDAKKLAKQLANENLKGSYVSIETGEFFRKSVLQKHAAWEGSNVLDTTFSGWFNKKILTPALGEQSFTVRAHRKIAETWGTVWNYIFGAWVRNTVLAPYRFAGVYQPTENITHYMATRGGSLWDGVAHLKSNQDLMERILDLPTTARSGLRGDVLSLTEELADTGSLSVIDMLKKHPDSWIPTPSNLVAFGRKSIKKEWTEWLSKVTDEEKMVRKIANGVGVLGLPVRVLADLSQSMSGAGELLVKATIADEKFFKNLDTVQDVVRKQVLDNGIDYLRKVGAPESEILKWQRMTQNNWERARGSATAFLKLQNIELIGAKTSEAYLTAPDFIKSLDLGLNELDSDKLVRHLTEEINLGLTAKINQFEGNIPEDQIDASVDEIFTKLKRAFEGGMNETLNPEGLAATGIFGNIHTTRPVTNNTRLMLNAFEEGKAFKLSDKIGDQTIAEILVDNDIVIEKGQNIGKVIEQFHNSIRPDVAAKITFSEEALDLIQKHKLGIKTTKGIPTKMTNAMKQQLQDMGYAPDAIRKLTPQQAWDILGGEEVSPEIQKVLSKHGIDLKDYASADDAIKALSDKYDSIFPVADMMPESARAIYGTEFPMTDDVLSEMQRVHFIKRGGEARKVAWEDVKKARTDIPESLWQAEEAARNSQGQLWGEIRKLDQVVMKQPDNVEALALRNSIQTYMDNWRRNTNAMSFYLKYISPGYITFKSRVNYKRAQLMWENFYKQVDTHNLEMVDMLRSGKPIAPLSHGEYLRRMWNIDLSFDELGNPFFKAKDPITGVWTEYPSVVTADGRVVVNYKLSRLMDESLLGVGNADILNAPLTLPSDELILMGRKGTKPFFAVPDEQIPFEQQKWFDTFISGSQIKSGDKTYKEYIKVMLQKTDSDLDEMMPDEIISALQKKAGKRKDEASTVLREFAEHLKENLDEFTIKNLTGGQVVATAPPIDVFADEVKAWVSHKLTQTASFEALNSEWDNWADYVKQAIRKGETFLTPFTEIEDSVLRRANNLVLDGLGKMEDALWNGGKVGDTAVEGAIPYMRTMMRVPNATMMDEWMRAYFPFWLFSTRGSKAFLRVAIDHPDWVAAYSRYRRFSERSAYKEGMIDSKGRVLPSKVGKIPINVWGKQYWVALDSSLPFFRYILAPPPSSQQDFMEEDDANFITKFGRWVRGQTEMRGISVNPIIDVALTALSEKQVFGINLPDPYSPWTALQKGVHFGLQALVPADLLPPNVDNWITSLLYSQEKRDDLTVTSARQKWYDSLVETRLMEQYLVKIQDEPSDERRGELADELRQHIMDRENSDVYMEAARAVEQTEYYKRLVGWGSGFYFNPASPAQAEIQAIKHQRNIAIASLNDEVKHQMFYPDMDEEEFYKYTVNDILNVPEGKIFDIRRATSWVSDDKGNPITDRVERRKQVNVNLERQIQTHQKYRTIEELREEYKKLSRSYPIGAEYKEPLLREARKDLYQSILETELSPVYALAEKIWSTGIKPQAMQEQHFNKLWWYMITKSRPWSSDYKNFDEYLKADALWRANLSQLAEELAPIFTANLAQYFSVFDEEVNINIPELVSQMVSNTNSKAVDQWDVDRVASVDAAIVDAWMDLYLIKYITEAQKIEGSHNKELFYLDFKRTTPPPSDDEIVEYVLNKFPQFEEKDVREALVAQPQNANNAAPSAQPVSRDRWTIDEYFDSGKTETDKLHQETWDIIRWAKPKRSTELRQAFISLGGDSNQWDAFYNLEGGVDAIPFHSEFKDEETFKKFADILKQAAMTINLKEPDYLELTKLAEAETLNEQFKGIVEMQLGEGFFQMYYSYTNLSVSDKRAFEKDRPQDFEKIKAYWSLMDKFGESNPLWASYYQEEPKKKASYYGYRGGGGRGRRSSGRAYAKQSDGSLLPIGMRSTTDPNQLLDPAILGRGGVAGVPRLSQRIWSTASVELRREVVEAATDETKTLSTAGVKYLRRIAERNPKHAEEIEEFIQSVSK